MAREERMEAARKCIRCSGTNLEPGRVQSTGHIYFRPSNARFLTLTTGDVPVNAIICLDCGTIELVGDVKKAVALTAANRPPQ